jgi:hypothetical protein
MRTLLKNRVGPTLLANICMENGSRFRNFTRMRELDLELLPTVTELKVSSACNSKGYYVDSFVFLGMLVPCTNVYLS